ncbi:MAG TPA: hypothetical protein VEL31_07965 [Ktedonobacteraceae bacterium]|nr:hypothetical protein [Ktedonobacteraceae bacterium]
MASRVYRPFSKRHSRYVRRRVFSAFLCRDCGRSIRRVKHVSVDLCPDCLSSATVDITHHT